MARSYFYSINEEKKLIALVKKVEQDHASVPSFKKHSTNFYDPVGFSLKDYGEIKEEKTASSLFSSKEIIKIPMKCLALAEVIYAGITHGWSVKRKFSTPDFFEETEQLRRDFKEQTREGLEQLFSNMPQITMAFTFVPNYNFSRDSSNVSLITRTEMVLAEGRAYRMLDLILLRKHHSKPLVVQEGMLYWGECSEWVVARRDIHDLFSYSE